MGQRGKILGLGDFMKCPHCDQVIHESEKRCPQCGKELSAKSETPSKEKQSEAGKTPSDAKERAEEAKSDKIAAEAQKSLKSLPILFPILFAALILGYYIFHARTPKEPPPAPKMSTDADHMFSSFDDAIDFVVQGKALFQAGQELSNGKTPTTVVASPMAAESQPGEDNAMFKAAENYSLSLEHFKEAKKILDREVSGNKPDVYQECRKRFMDDIDQYAEAVKIFNERSKAILKQNEQAAAKYALSDGMAKIEIADKLMSDFLFEGCEQHYFNYASKQSPEIKKKLYGNYQAFFGSRFETIRPALNNLLGLAGSAAPLPSAMPVSPMPQ